MLLIVHNPSLDCTRNDFFCAIATTMKPDDDRGRYCVSFKVESKDKSSKATLMTLSRLSSIKISFSRSQ